MSVTTVTPSSSARGSWRRGSRISPATRLASQNPPNEKKMLTRPSPSASTSGGAPARRAANGTKCDQDPVLIVRAMPTIAASAATLAAVRRFENADAQTQPRHVDESQSPDSAESDPPFLPCCRRPDHDEVLRQAERQRRRDARVHDQQRLPSIEEGDALAERLAQIDVSASRLRESGHQLPERERSAQD